MIILRKEYAASAYVRRTSGRTLDLSVTSTAPFRFRDAVSGTLWTTLGTEVVNASVPTESLEMANGYVSEWYEWVNSYPDTDLAE